MFKKPDTTAPRFKKDSKAILTMDLFNRFKKKHPQHNITFDQFKSVIKSHSEKMWSEVVHNRDGILLPENIGSIFLGSTKIKKKKNIDIQASIKAGKPILHRNWKTDGHVAKIFFSSHLNRSYSAENGHGLWGFRGHRDFKRTVSREYPGKWQNYIVIIGRKKASQTYKKHQYRNFAEGETERELKTYNEFDLK